MSTNGIRSPADTVNVAVWASSRPLSGTVVRTQIESGPAIARMPSSTLYVHGTTAP